MKKRAFPFASLVLNGAFIHAQTWIKTTSPCNEQLLKDTPAEWRHWGDPPYAKLTSQQQQEIFNRAQTWNDQPYRMRFKQAIEENFPIELPAMIDK